MEPWSSLIPHNLILMLCFVTFWCVFLIFFSCSRFCVGWVCMYHSRLTTRITWLPFTKNTFIYSLFTNNSSKTHPTTCHSHILSAKKPRWPPVKHQLRAKTHYFVNNHITQLVSNRAVTRNSVGNHRNLIPSGTKALSTQFICTRPLELLEILKTVIRRP